MSNFTKLKLCHTLGISQSTHIWVKGALTALLLVLCGNVAKAQSDLTFKEGIRYSQWVINSRLGDFYGNKRSYGFTTYNNDLSVKENKTKWIDSNGKDDYPIQVDYVAGLVAKATIEAADYYKNYDWSKPWFKSVEWYGNKCTVPNAPDNLDAINASKMYFGISSLANGSFNKIVASTTAEKTKSGIQNALEALSNYNTNYAFPANSTLNTHDISGGWWHKNGYANQMWLDGQYMGPAVLAQLINDYKTCTDTEYTAISSSDWNLITKQFTIVWQQCWDSTEKLLYHAFSSEPLNYWTSDPEIWETAKTSTSKWTSMTSAGHSAGFWGRAEGWYFLALVDVLEQMQIAKVTNSDNYTILHGYLVELANGIKARQDANSGCWYQILNKDNTYTAHYYAGKSSSKANYLESSCTAIFTAAYLKAIRLGLLSEETYKATAEAGYKGLIKQFMKQQSDGTVQLFGCCKSAGLGTSTKFSEAKFRDGSNAYYLLGDDVPATTDYTEGKVLGAFILAATEYERQYQNSTLLAKDLNPSYTIKSGKSISVEVLGDVTPTYQWYNASTDQAVSGAKDASFTPATSGKYYCKITVKPATSAKTRAASDGTYEITTRATDVTVEETSTGGETSTGTVVYFTGNEKTTSNEDVLTVVSGDMKSKASTITYKGSDYSNALKIGSSTELTLKLTTESDVTLVFDTHTSGNYTIKVGDTKYPIGKDGLVTIKNLADGNYTIKKGDSNPNLYAVDIQPTGPSMSISTQPKSTDYVTGGQATPLSIDVTFSNATASDYKLSYQWYSNTANSITGGTAVGTNANTYTPVITSAGTTYYYCVVTATKKEGEGTLTATSDVATITVSAPYVEFTTQPQGAVYVKDATPKDLSVEATTNVSNVTISYQWYSNTTSSTEGGTAIYGEKKSTYTPSTATTGTTYYYCVASVTSGSETTISATSNIVSVAVVTAIYKYKVLSSDTSSPGVNGVKYITTTSDGTGKTGDKLVKMTFGGWKWGTNTDKNNHSYYVPNKKNELQVDSWSAAETEGVSKLDGYDYWFSGAKDAVDESKAASKDENGKEVPIYGSVRYGWFKTQTKDSEGKVTTYPFTLPVRGAYMTFEPTQNGWLTIYILQNGAWNSDTNKGIDIKPGEFRMHSFFITNQRGLTVQDFAPGMYSYEVNQQVETGYSCSKYEENDKPAENEMDENKKDISYWPEFWTLNRDERKAVHDHWKNGTGGSETVIELSNGSFLLIQKAVIKYRFHVTGSETYYFFSNFSKMGFSGATFQPDNAQPTAELTLSDTEKYTAPEAGKNAVVENVTIPQYESITFTRTFKPNQWTTLTLPFNLTQEEVQKIFGDGTQIIMLDKATLENGGAHLHFIYHEIQNVLPGYPYLIKPTLAEVNETNDANVSVIKADNNTALTSFTVYNKCINPSISQFEVNTVPYTFMGTPGYCTPDATDKPDYSVQYYENDIFVSEGNGNLYVSSGASYGKGYRAWLQNNNNTTAVKSISVVMSSFSDDDDTTTSIDVAEMAPDLIEALGIQTGVYNLSGQRVANDTRNLKAGIYIINGKKTVVR